MGRIGIFIMLSFLFHIHGMLLLNKFLLECSWFTVLFLLYSKVNQLYIHPFFFRFSSHVGYYRVWSRVPCAVQWVLTLPVSHTVVCVCQSLFIRILLWFLSSAFCSSQHADPFDPTDPVWVLHVLLDLYLSMSHLHNYCK